MKRFVLALLFCLISFNVFAGDFVITQPEGLAWSTYVSDNTTGDYKLTNVTVTTIIPRGNTQSRVLGFTVMSLTGHAGITGNSENVASLWDEISGTEAPVCFGEAEAIDESFDGMWYPIPKIVIYGLTIRQGANTRVIVFYE